MRVESNRAVRPDPLVRNDLGAPDPDPNIPILKEAKSAISEKNSDEIRGSHSLRIVDEIVGNGKRGKKRSRINLAFFQKRRILVSQSATSKPQEG